MPEALKAIKEADAVIIGPGSLYTSIIPNFMVKGVAKAAHEAAAMKIYICNMMTQQGETLGYDLSDHINAINEHAGHDIIEYAIVNSGRIPEDSALRYMDEYAKPVEIDWDNIAAKGIKVVGDDFVRIDKGYVRHDYNALSRCIFKLINQEQKDSIF
ncbi:Gluconeogenesis factor [bioreactor metagenome]|uniref:Gluconeogenesis factor n=2 Tax=root TaxID=1 RepID=A0A645J7Z5_9ZZZZ